MYFIKLKASAICVYQKHMFLQKSMNHLLKPFNGEGSLDRVSKDFHDMSLLFLAATSSFGFSQDMLDPTSDKESK